MGDTVYVFASASYGSLKSESKSASVKITNGPLTITSLTLTPRQPFTADKMVATVKLKNPDKIPLYYNFTWRKNGKVMQTVTNSRLGKDTYDLGGEGKGNKGDVIEVRVSISPLIVDEAVTARAVPSIINSVPVISSLSLSPKPPTSTQTLTATVTGRDLDGDRISPIYSWKIGKQLLAGERGDKLDLSKYPSAKTGSVVTSEVRFSDGTALSKTTRASVTVQASPPRAEPRLPHPASKRCRLQLSPATMLRNLAQ